MIDAPTPSLWAQLRADRPTHDDALATVTAGTMRDGRELLFGIDRRADLHLLVPIDDGEGDKPADLQGLRVRHQIIEGNLHYLDLIASAAHERCFSPLVGEVLNAVIEQGREPLKAVKSIIRAWQSAWKPAVLDMPKIVRLVYSANC